MKNYSTNSNQLGVHHKQECGFSYGVFYQFHNFTMSTFKSGLLDLGGWQSYEWVIHENEYEKFVALKLWEGTGAKIMVTLSPDDIESLTNSLQTGLMSISK